MPVLVRQEVFANPVTLPKPSEGFKRRTIEFLRGALTITKKNVEAGLDSKVVGIMTTTGCHHRCAHCGEASPPYEKGKIISLDTVRAAGEKLGFENVCLTGGEPLDHPDIVQIQLLTKGNIYATNGFSPFVHPREKWAAILKELDFGSHISFHLFDRWNGINEGRDAAIKYLLINGKDVVMAFLTTPQNVKETLIAWLKTISRILDDAEMLRTPATAVELGYSLANLPIVGFSPVCSPVWKTGMASKGFEGIWSENVTVLSRADDSRERDLKGFSNSNGQVNGILLEPSGDLGSWFLSCPNWMEHKRARIGSSITDSKETIASRLTETVLRFFTENLDRKEEDWKREVEQLVDNTAMCIEILRRQLHTYSDAGFTEALAGLKEKLQSLGLKEADVPNLSSERVDSVVQALRTRITSEINTAIGLITKE
ncbi:TPA: radical SAM protein [Candidatus Micrarchaeota archaeon]|nr:radical SAM protein [Candidatus Micrarchaeota archaeon]